MVERPSRSITSQMVRDVFAGAKSNWNPPSDADCGSIAEFLDIRRQIKENREVRGTEKRDAAGRKRIAAAKRVRSAIGVLLTELPELAAQAHRVLSDQTEHAALLDELLIATRRTAGYWADLDGRYRRFDRRSRWALCADCMARQVYMSWQRANPAHVIGKPQQADQPLTRVLVGLINLVGYEVTNGQLAKHFERSTDNFFFHKSED